MSSHTNASNMRISSSPKPLEIQRRVYIRMARRAVTRPSKMDTIMKAAGPSVLGFTKFGGGKVLKTDAGGICMLTVEQPLGGFCQREQAKLPTVHSVYSNMRRRALVTRRRRQTGERVGKGGNKSGRDLGWDGQSSALGITLGCEPRLLS